MGRAFPASGSGFVDEFQLSGRFQRLGVKGADFGHPTYIKGHHQPVAGDAGCDDAGAFRQRRGNVGGAVALPSPR